VKPMELLGTDFGMTLWWPWLKNFYGESDAGSFQSGSIIARMWIDQDMKAEMGY